MENKRKRGRPRKYTGDAEKVKAFRQRFEGRRLDVYISEAANQWLKALTAAWECTPSQAIERLLMEMDNLKEEG